MSLSATRQRDFNKDFMPSSRARLGFAVTILAAFAVAGCATDPEPAPAPASAPSETPAPLAVSVPMPDLGPPPPRPELTDEQRETLRLERLDSAWERVVTHHPGAVRPDLVFAGYLEPEDRTNALTTCFTEKGVQFGLGPDAEGKVTIEEVSTSTEEEAVGAYLCEGRYPVRTLGPPSDAQLSWMYDYLTQFLVPCYEANGIENPPAPPRADFIASWGRLIWFPDMRSLPMDSPEAIAIREACPPPA